ncbi:MAG: endolytic transglycosylase MltG, partial [Clostridia bacterium]|nr:endolytic transglycosylase MltG [Clostridia bacterium]
MSDMKNKSNDAFDVSNILGDVTDLSETREDYVPSMGGDPLKKDYSYLDDFFGQSDVEDVSTSDPADYDAPRERKSNKNAKGKNKKKEPKEKKKRGCSCFAVFVCFSLIFSILLAGVIIIVASDLTGLGKELLTSAEYSSVQVQVKEGTSVSEIAKELEDKGILLSDEVFLLYLKATGKGGNVNYGFHDFETNMGYGAILNSLAEPAKAEDVTVTIPSGKTVEQIFEILDEEGVCPYEDLRKEVVTGTFDSELWKAIPKDRQMYLAMEGYLSPDTYHFYPNDDPHRVIQVMLDNLEKSFPQKLRDDAKEMGYSTHDVLTMASVIELEACGYYDEMDDVSAVFHNRLTEWPEVQRLL